LYGRGAGSTPAGGSFTNARSSAERALLCDGRGRWFDSSRAYHFADVAQREERRASNPERPVRFGSSALEGPWCKREHGELQPRWSGFDPWRACFEDRRGPKRSGYLGIAVRLRTRSARARPRRMSCCGPERFRLSVAGSNPVRSTPRSGSSVAEQCPAVKPMTAATSSSKVVPRAGEDRLSHPRSKGGREPPPGERRVSTPVFTPRPRPHMFRTAGRSGCGYRQSARANAREVAGSTPAHGQRYRPR
jgi:hypothetical protein